MIDLNSPSEKQVREFHVALADRFGVRFFDNTSMFFKILMFFLRRIFEKYGVKSMTYERADTVLSDISLRPCCLGKWILLPWRIGDSEVPYRSQIATAVHECAHALRIAKYPGATSRWYGEYFTSPSFRALEEGAAQIVAAEVRYWATGDFRRLDLEGYLCPYAARDSAQRAYDQRRRRVERFGQGSSTSTVSAFAIKWLKEWWSYQ